MISQYCSILSLIRHNRCFPCYFVVRTMNEMFAVFTLPHTLSPPPNPLPTCAIDGHVNHYNDVIMDTIASQITSLTFVYLTVYSDADQRNHQSPASLAFVRGIHRRPVNSPHKWPVTRKMFSFDDVINEFVGQTDPHLSWRRSQTQERLELCEMT